ncbi:serine/threonine-protein kinase bud32 [Polyrhizophydium stewartii]|uniref:non-specific serine/threonine protein kinase n=1 Tax=Polyrhizophydium stewartii TaxID=2732419 RepID=A0ABR4N2A9_9FUNG
MATVVPVKQGAEARLLDIDFGGRPAFAKQRFKKAYRHPVLDERLTARRVTQEARTMLRLRRAGIDAPALFLLDTANSIIYVERIEGDTVRDVLRGGVDDAQFEAIARAIGADLAKIHDMDLIHGDLTTSNMMLRHGTRKLVWIDFGLSYTSTLAEDKGVDLYVLERAIQSTHPNQAKAMVRHAGRAWRGTLLTPWNKFDGIIRQYTADSKNAQPVIRKFEEVRLRGRKRTAFG